MIRLIIPDWINFCQDAIKNQWSPKTIINRLDIPLLDVYGIEFHDVVIKRLREMMKINK